MQINDYLNQSYFGVSCALAIPLQAGPHSRCSFAVTTGNLLDLVIGIRVVPCIRGEASDLRFEFFDPFVAGCKALSLFISELVVGDASTGLVPSPCSFSVGMIFEAISSPSPLAAPVELLFAANQHDCTIFRCFEHPIPELLRIFLGVVCFVFVFLSSFAPALSFLLGAHLELGDFGLESVNFLSCCVGASNLLVVVRRRYLLLAWAISVSALSTTPSQKSLVFLSTQLTNSLSGTLLYYPSSKLKMKFCGFLPY